MNWWVLNCFSTLIWLPLQDQKPFFSRIEPLFSNPKVGPGPNNISVSNGGQLYWWRKLEYREKIWSRSQRPFEGSIYINILRVFYIPCAAKSGLLGSAVRSNNGWITSLMNTPFFCHKFNTRTILLWKKPTNTT